MHERGGPSAAALAGERGPAGPAGRLPTSALLSRGAQILPPRTTRADSARRPIGGFAAGYNADTLLLTTSERQSLGRVSACSIASRIAVHALDADRVVVYVPSRCPRRGP